MSHYLDDRNTKKMFPMGKNSEIFGLSEFSIVFNTTADFYPLPQPRR
jgi:hypothetical protein